MARSPPAYCCGQRHSTIRQLLESCLLNLSIRADSRQDVSLRDTYPSLQTPSSSLQQLFVAPGPELPDLKPTICANFSKELWLVILLCVLVAGRTLKLRFHNGFYTLNWLPDILPSGLFSHEKFSPVDDHCDSGRIICSKKVNVRFRNITWLTDKRNQKPFPS